MTTQEFNIIDFIIPPGVSWADVVEEEERLERERAQKKFSSWSNMVRGEDVLARSLEIAQALDEEKEEEGWTKVIPKTKKRRRNPRNDNDNKDFYEQRVVKKVLGMKVNPLPSSKFYRRNKHK